jgi:hypothetical protein
LRTNRDTTPECFHARVISDHYTNPAATKPQITAPQTDPGLPAGTSQAVVAGARSFAAIGQWASELTAPQLAELGLSREVAPDASTFRKVFARLDAATLDQLAGAFVWASTRVAGAAG